MGPRLQHRLLTLYGHPPRRFLARHRDGVTLKATRDKVTRDA